MSYPFSDAIAKIVGAASKRHAAQVEQSIEDTLLSAGLWDGADHTKETAALNVADRMETRVYSHKPLYTEVWLDGRLRAQCRTALTER